MENFIIPPSVTSIEKYAFNGCSSLTEIKIPPLVKSIGDFAFYGCSSLMHFYVSPSIITFGKNCFDHCKYIFMKYQNPNSIYLFQKETNYLIITSKIASIKKAFDLNNNNSITLKINKVNLFPSVQFIATNAFRSCSRITHCLIPSF